MVQQEIEMVLDQMLSPNFYRQDFKSVGQAAKYLGVDVGLVTDALDDLEESLHTFIYNMRVEDVLDCLQKDPHEPYARMAARAGFRSKWHMLWHFYRRERCLPRRWAYRQGIIL